VQTFLSIAALRRANVPPDQIIEQLRDGDVVIDVTDHNTPQQPTTAVDARSDVFMPPVVLSNVLARLEAVERNQARLLGEALRWGMVLGAIGALVAGGFVLWLLWLVA
jgi:hypothetical protein